MNECVDKSAGDIESLTIQLLPLLHTAMEMNTALLHSVAGELITPIHHKVIVWKADNSHSHELEVEPYVRNNNV